MLPPSSVWPRKYDPQTLPENPACGLPVKNLALKIMRAAAEGDTASLNELLADDSALPDFESPLGVTPLMMAARFGQAATTEILAAHPLVSVNRQNEEGYAALHMAAINGSPACIRSLLTHMADPSLQSAQGTAFGLCRTNEAREAFWQNKGFVRYMRRVEPGHPRFSPPKEPEKISLAEAFGVGIAPAATSSDLRRRSFSDIKRDFTGCTDAVFVFEAGRDHLVVLEMIVSSRGIPDQETLNAALSVAVEGADRRSVVHFLLQCGADPNAPYGSCPAISIHRSAFLDNFTGAFEEMVLWGNIPDKEMRRVAIGAGRAGQTVDFQGAVALHARKKEMASKGAQSLELAFVRAVINDDLNGMMAAYAEGRKGKFFGGPLEADKEIKAEAVLRALQHDRLDLAKMMAADGCDIRLLSGLPDTLSPAAKKLAEDIISGAVQAQPVPPKRVRKSKIWPWSFT